jgi:hypothetical protein
MFEPLFLVGFSGRLSTGYHNNTRIELALISVD